MLDKFRDLSFSAKIAAMFGAVLSVIVLLIGFGLGVKYLTEISTPVAPPTGTNIPDENPDDTEPQPVTPTPDNDDSNPYAPDSTQDEKSLMEGFLFTEKFIEKLCNINPSQSYSEYVAGLTPSLSEDNIVQIMTEQVYKNYEYQKCVINVGQPASEVSKNRYKTSLAVSVESKYVDVAEKTTQNYTYNAIMEYTSNGWKIYSATAG
jgi:hypothetical protein